MTQTSASEAIKYTNMDSETPNVGYVLKAFRKLSIESNDVVHLKDEQEKTVDCLPRWKGCSRGYADWIWYYLSIICNYNDRKESS